MKKLTAMLLALCMLLAVIPVLGEGTDFSGNWYARVGEINIGCLTFNADGTASADMAGSKSEGGTWSAEDNTITMTMDGVTNTFTYDGEALTTTLMPVPFSREEGKISYEVFGAYMNGEEYILPEGVTEADLLLAQSDFMAFVSENAEALGMQGSGTGTAPAADTAVQVTVLQENFSVAESYSGFRGTYLAKVQNGTEAPLFVTGGSLIVKDAAGTQVGEAKYLYTSGSKYLEPGEVSFVSMQADLAENGDYTFEAAIEAKTEAYYNTDRIVTVAAPVTETDTYGNTLISATVTNDTEAPLGGITVVYVLEDAEGNLLDISTEALYRHLLGAGSEITMVTSVNSKTLEDLKAKGITPATVEVSAFAENKD